MDGDGLNRPVRGTLAKPDGQMPALSALVLPAIALPVYAGAMNQQPALAAGFQVQVSNPIDSAALVAIVARLCGRNRGEAA